METNANESNEENGDTINGPMENIENRNNDYTLNENTEEKKKKKKTEKLYKSIELHYLVNALPYIDSYDNELGQNAKKLIEEEMHIMKETNQVKQYLENFPIPDLLYLNNKNSIIQNELKRCEQNNKMTLLNFDHYNIENNSTSNINNNSTVNQAKKTFENHQLVLENLHNALINIELMNKYKEVIWSEHMKTFTQVDINLQNSIKSLKENIDNINKKRKLHHLSYVNDLTTLQNERKDFKRKNSLVLKEIKKLISENMLMKYKQNLI
ncbi:conserved protein, unknown function [Plasmodium berghei]|uniref:Pre-mRNA-splicing factor CWF7, putative n=2 Tax=Plasmodium berghei TaxID=5821 RepID=A0A509ANQ9_PLABA|nr:pre-mRNA-splicing factor CWF7, putative [Plasmodium berghei ANKA]CXI79783.1 conserved protein, unknown function [Plasmodium berghei]SCM25330.1 conserved protein, unknown function [Plasmodium berghei]SCN27335.1 conserved protein, unknown function [Plasmodium berghei]SCO61971.1 conserved protein, unknown function [Plasmodium berghei]SCO63760.1 conserved protein, unknown function [Plasmodium berghei]|eukprot:XP_034422969.1 pre-mRNA-splicing factor CWF7, putative [Plasmodium berghei ANKA]